MTDMPRVLVIEDDMGEDDIEELLRPPTSKWRDRFGETYFRFEVARWVDEAFECLRRGVEGKDPYEAVLLDLGLPRTRQEYESGLAGFGSSKDEYEKSVGQELATQISEGYEATVVMFTHFRSELDDLLHALRSGVMDYFEKKELESNDGREKLFARMVEAVGRNRHSKLQRRRIERVQWLGDRKERQNLARMRNCVSAGLQQSCGRLEELSRLLSSQYGLSAEEGVERGLAGLKEALDMLSATVGDLFPFDTQTATYESIDVAEEISTRVAELRPCYVYREVTPEWAPPGTTAMRTKTFKEDLQFLLDELLFDPLETAPAGSRVQIQCRRSDDGNDIVVSLTRPSALRTASGYSVEPAVEDLSGGLQLLKGVANNMSARLEKTDQNDNTTLTLALPVMDRG